MMMTSFVLRTTTTSAPQNSVVVYVSHNLHRGVTDKIVVVVKLVVVAGNNTQRKRRKQRSPLRRTFSLLLFYSFLFLMLLFRVRFSSLLCRDDEMCVFVKKNIPFWQSRNFFLQIIFSSLLPLFIFHLEKKEAIFFYSRRRANDFLCTIQKLHKNYAHEQHQQKRIDSF